MQTVIVEVRRVSQSGFAAYVSAAKDYSPRPSFSAHAFAQFRKEDFLWNGRKSQKV